MAKLTINGEAVELDVDGATPLLWALREQLGLTGTKYSCGIGLCGSCTVHIDGEAVRACVVPVNSLSESQNIVTIEGLSPDGSHDYPDFPYTSYSGMSDADLRDLRAYQASLPAVRTVGYSRWPLAYRSAVMT